MIKANIRDIKSILPSLDFDLGTFSAEFEGVCIDSRSVSVSSCFLCIKGENYDAHDYIEEAIKNGATLIIGQNDALTSQKNKLTKMLEEYSNVRILGVSDTVQSLGLIAKWWRIRIAAPVFFITGSCGKTSTKQILATILGDCIGEGTFSRKSFNNNIGLPLTLLSCSLDDKWLVLEAGMNDFGEIDYLSSISSPEIGVITGIGAAHLEKLGSIAGVAKAKLELISHLKCDSSLILNSDDEYLLNHSKYCPTVRPQGMQVKWFGQSKSSEVCISEISIDSQFNNESLLETNFKLNNKEASIPLLGAHHSYNSAAAVLAALSAFPCLAIKDCIESLKNVLNEDMRFDIINLSESIDIINDSYNANPTSTKASIETFCRINKFDTKIAIIGQMGELGIHSEELHAELGEWISSTNLDLVLAIGENSQDLVNSAKENDFENIYAFSDKEKLLSKINDIIQLHNGKLDNQLGILFKGSRSEKLEDIITVITKKIN